MVQRTDPLIVTIRHPYRSHRNPDKGPKSVHNARETEQIHAETDIITPCYVMKRKTYSICYNNDNNNNNGTTISNKIIIIIIIITTTITIATKIMINMAIIISII